MSADELTDWGMMDPPKRRIEDYTFVSVGTKEKAYNLCQRYHLSAKGGRIKYDPARDRLVFIFEDQAVGRSLKGELPKWYRYTDSDKPILYKTDEGFSDKNPIVLVEDSISAARIAPYVNSMALLGTDFRASYLQYLEDYQEVYVALDKDATNKAIDIARWLSYIRPTKVTMIHKDLKDYSYDELLDYFNDWGIEYAN